MVSCHVIENQEIGFKKFGTEPRRVVGLHQILDGNVTHNYYLLGTTTNLSMLFQALGLWLHLTEVFFLGLGLTVTSDGFRGGSFGSYEPPSSFTTNEIQVNWIANLLVLLARPTRHRSSQLVPNLTRY